MQPEIQTALETALTSRDVSADALRAAIGALMDGRCTDVEIAALLTALAVKGETAEELAGAALAMRERATPIRTSRTGLLDTCGTGGDRLHTFNISTATALVAAAAGVPVAKHGNRSASSRSGSADVLESLGVRIDLPPEQVGRCIDELGIGFCFARLLHAAMKHVAPVRTALGFRTIFNLLGPLTNPARAEYQLIGCNRVETAEKLALAIARLRTKRTFVVCGDDQLDEVALWGVTTVFDVQGEHVGQRLWTAGDLGLPETTVDQLRVESPEQSAAVIRGVLDGTTQGPPRDIVLANAAAALVAAGRTPTPQAGVAHAAETIDSGAAADKLRQLVEWTRRA
jgi:anthranilate phosphoribosyltransferase